MKMLTPRKKANNYLGPTPIFQKKRLDDQELGQGLWVFAYGSLMWRPNFPFDCQVKVRCAGVRRSFCIRSVYHRGSYMRPGLVLGLCNGGVCDGVLYHVPAHVAKEVLFALRQREQVTKVYREVYKTVTFSDGSHQKVKALCYVADPMHKQYVGKLSILAKAEIIKRAAGFSGTNLDYLISTIRHLHELGIKDDELRRILVLTGCQVRKR